MSASEACLCPHGDGVQLTVRAMPRSRRPGIKGVHNGALKLALRAPAVDGKANAELVLWVASRFGLAKTSVRWLSGSHDRLKRLWLPLPLESARAALRECLGATIEAGA